MTTMKDYRGKKSTQVELVMGSINERRSRRWVMPAKGGANEGWGLRWS